MSLVFSGADTDRPLVGVLALQGDVREHEAALVASGAQIRRVRRPADLDGIDGIVLPGGESTTLGLLLTEFGMLAPLRAAVRGGLPTYGSCAGMVLLADRVLDGAAGQALVGGLDVTVRRNAFGRQVDSFEGKVTVAGLSGGPVWAVFIRAPWVEDVGAHVAVLATLGHEVHGRVTGSDAGSLAARAVVVRQGSVLATSFHPELTGDLRMHQMFLDMITNRAGDEGTP